MAVAGPRPALWRHTFPVSAYLIPLATGSSPEGPWATVEVEGGAGRGSWPAPPGPPKIEVVGDRIRVTGLAAELALLGRARGSAPGGVELRRAAAALLRPPPPLRLGSHRWVFGRRTLILGVVNVTPDSFSGDGVGASPAAALERARALVAAGADGLDLGGESSRPGHQPVSLEEELARVVPAVRAIAGELDVPVFVDTVKAPVAIAALEAGAVGVNDIWGLRGDPGMAGVVRARGAAVICMHNQEGVAYRDLGRELALGLGESLAVAEKAGIARSQVVLDPGIGFGKTPEQSLTALSRLRLLTLLGAPLLVGTSRKSMVGWLLGNRPVEDRLWGTAATVAWAATAGAHIVRVHDVAEISDVVRVVDRLRAAEAG